MKIFNVFFCIMFVFCTLFGGSHPPSNPGNFIEDLIDKLLSPLLCIPEKPVKKNLVGAWDMSLVSVTPEIPKIPGLNPIKDKSTWLIIDSDTRLFISYDGSAAKWYNEPLDITFTASRHYGTPNSTKKACTFSGTGSAVKDSLFLIYSDISARYTDSVSITMNGDDSVTATIKVTVSGQYTEEIPFMKAETKSINAVETITYSGVRKSK